MKQAEKRAPRGSRQGKEAWRRSLTAQAGLRAAGGALARSVATTFHPALAQTSAGAEVYVGRVIPYTTTSWKQFLRLQKYARVETKASIHHPLWVVVVYRIGLPIVLVVCVSYAFLNLV